MLGYPRAGGSHGKQDGSRALHRDDDARALPVVPPGRIGRPCSSAGGRGRRSGEGQGKEWRAPRRRASIARAQRVAPPCVLNGRQARSAPPLVGRGWGGTRLAPQQRPPPRRFAPTLPTRGRVKTEFA